MSASNTSGDPELEPASSSRDPPMIPKQLSVANQIDPSWLDPNAPISDMTEVSIAKVVRQVDQLIEPSRRSELRELVRKLESAEQRDVERFVLFMRSSFDYVHKKKPLQFADLISSQLLLRGFYRVVEDPEIKQRAPQTSNSERNIICLGLYRSSAEFKRYVNTKGQTNNNQVEHCIVRGAGPDTGPMKLMALCHTKKGWSCETETIDGRWRLRSFSLDLTLGYYHTEEELNSGKLDDHYPLTFWCGVGDRKFRLESANGSYARCLTNVDDEFGNEYSVDCNRSIPPNWAELNNRAKTTSLLNVLKSFTRTTPEYRPQLLRWRCPSDKSEIHWIACPHDPQIGQQSFHPNEYARRLQQRR